MILKNKADLNILIEGIHSSLISNNLHITQAQCADLIASSQGFSNTDSFVNSFPIFVDINDTDKKFNHELKKIVIDRKSICTLPSSILSSEIKYQSRFPILAGNEQSIALDIDWNCAHISFPLIVRDDGVYDSANLYYGNTTRYQIGVRLTETEYNTLCEQLEPLVDIVENGFTYNGEQTHPTLTSKAKVAQEEIESTIRSYNENILYTEIAVGAPEFFGEGFPTLNDLIDEELTEIRFEGSRLLNHSTSDIELRKIVGREHDDERISDDVLYRELKEYRDECRAIFEYNPKTL